MIQNSQNNVPLSSTSFLSEATITPSAKAKKIAELFIENFSQEAASPSWTNQQKDALLSNIEHNQLKEMLTQNLALQLEQGHQLKQIASFSQLGRGFHNVVWIHSDYPQVAFKFMKKKEAEQQKQVAQKALEVTREIKRCWIQIPRATSIDIDELTAYVEERLPLSLNSEEHQEFWIRVLTYYQSSHSSNLFKENLHTLIEQIKTLIERVGIWDIGNHNLPEIRIDGKGVCGTDFENVKLDLKHVSKGISRLANLVLFSPLVDSALKKYEEMIPALFAEKLEVYEKDVRMFGAYRSPPTEKQFHDRFYWQLEIDRQNALARQAAIQRYDTEGYVTGEEFIPYTADLSGLDEQETRLAQALLSKITKELSNRKGQTTTLISKRSLFLQPGHHFSCSNSYTHDRFLKVLHTLKEQGILISWCDEYQYSKAFNQDLKCVPYHIYF